MMEEIFDLEMCVANIENKNIVQFQPRMYHIRKKDEEEEEEGTLSLISSIAEFLLFVEA